MSNFDNNPPFQQMVRASGLGEVWTHSTDSPKFGQFGWRCTNKETSYNNATFIGNWNEERFDNKFLVQAKPLPSPYGHYYETTYHQSYNFKPYEVPKELKHLQVPNPKAFPGHQTETDSALCKSFYNSWQTTSRSSFVNPKIREKPLKSQ